MSSQTQETSSAASSSGLTEAIVIHGFHEFLVNALSQAKLEKLLDEDTLASAEADVMISGPALCLYFAALRSTSNPPGVPIPGTSRSAAPLILSTETCPPIFQPLFRLWSQSVPAIQALSSSDRHDLARIICDREPLSGTPNTALNRIAADLRSVAIEITQRRTFQERYQSDLQQALDAGVPAGPSGEKRRIAAFMPPPSYDDASSEGGHSRTHSASYSQNGHSGNPSPTSSAHSSPHRAPVPMPVTPSRLNEPLPPTPHNPAAEGMASIESRIIPPQSPSHLTVGVASSTFTAATTSTSGGRASSSSSRSRSASPTLLPPDSPAINLIRETLYAALGEVIASTPSIKPLMQSDPARAYYASVALSILTVSTDCITVDGGVITPLGRVLTIKECPEGYRPLMAELGRISKQAKEIETEDNDRTIAAVRAGQVAPEPRLERVRRMLEYGVAKEEARYDAHESAPPPPAPSSQPVMRNAPQPGNAIGLQSPPPVLPPRRTPPPPMPIPIVPSAPLATAAEESQRRSVEQEPATTHEAGNTPSSTSPPRSSSEQPRGRHLLHKLRPGSAGGSNGNKTATTPPTTSSGLPPIAPKPSNSPSRYPAPTSPPPSRPPISSTSEESPQGPGMAGIGARPGLGGVGGLIPNGVTSSGGVGGFATSTGGSASPPKAAMMLHQGSLNAAGGPYGTALGSGARIPGTDTGIALPATRPEAQHPPQAVASTSTAAPVANDIPAATSDNPRRSLEGTSVQFANRINGLALQLTRLRMFQERQDMVFKILASVHD